MTNSAIKGLEPGCDVLYFPYNGDQPRQAVPAVFLEYTGECTAVISISGVKRSVYRINLKRL